jgi:flagellar basal body P-ring formation protein FlgA
MMPCFKMNDSIGGHIKGMLNSLGAWFKRFRVQPFSRVRLFSLLYASLFFLFALHSAQGMVLLTNAQVRGDGIFLADLVLSSSNAPVPHLRIADSPGFGQAIVLSRRQVQADVQRSGQDATSWVWSGAEFIRVTRRARLLGEAELREQVVSILQRQIVRDKGELEMRLLRPWSPIPIPDENYTLKVLDMPVSGVSSAFFLRCELVTSRETIGPIQLSLAAKVWRDLWVARSTLMREQVFSEADVARERRDVLALREAPCLLPEASSRFEVAEQVPQGAPIYARCVRLRPVVFRGGIVDAQVQSGAMTISLKVEVLENGIPGQTVRVRNPQSKREFKGKVQDEQTILVSL